MAQQMSACQSRSPASCVAKLFLLLVWHSYRSFASLSRAFYWFCLIYLVYDFFIFIAFLCFFRLIILAINFVGFRKAGFYCVFGCCCWHVLVFNFLTPLHLFAPPVLSCAHLYSFYSFFWCIFRSINCRLYNFSIVN